MYVLFRTLLLAGALHLLGAPQFDELRPAALDPLKTFHRETTSFVVAMMRDVRSVPLEVRGLATSYVPQARS